MKKIVIAVAALTLMSGAAVAQGSTGPAAQQDNMNKPGTMNNGFSAMNSGTTGTTGANVGMKREGVKKDGMIKGGASRDGDGQIYNGGKSPK